MLSVQCEPVYKLPDTVTIEGEPQRVTVQQALLLRFREEALRGQIWAGKLYQKLIAAVPGRVNEHDRIDLDVRVFRAKALLGLMLEAAEREKSHQNCEPTEGDDVK